MKTRGVFDAVVSTRNTVSDIEDNVEIDITLRFVGLNKREHDSLHSDVFFRDKEGEKTRLAAFHGTAPARFDWEEGQWYRLPNAIGSEHQGRKGLKPPKGDTLVIEEVDAPDTTDEYTSSEKTDSSDFKEKESKSEATLSNGPYLQQFNLEDRVRSVEVYEHRLEVPNGMKVAADGGSPTSITHKAASRFAARQSEPVITAGNWRLLSSTRLSGKVQVNGKTVKPECVDERTLRADDDYENGRIEEMIKRDIKRAARGRYKVYAINDIRERQPFLEAESGDFEAYRKFAVRVRVDTDGTVTCGVDVKTHIQSTFSLPEYERRGHDIEGTEVQHDTSQYGTPGGGFVMGEADIRYTDPNPELGNIPTSEFHRRNERLKPKQIDAFEKVDPRLVVVNYQGDPDDESGQGSQLPHMLVITPSFDQLKDLDKDFHDRVHSASRLLPSDRMDPVSDFVSALGRLPTFMTTMGTTPSNAGHTRLDINTSRQNLRFANGETARTGKQGLYDHGVYQQPDSFDILAIYPKRNKKESESFFQQFQRKLGQFGSPADSFETEVYTLGPEFSYANVAEDAGGYDGVLAVVPNKDAAEDADYADPRDEFKRTFGQETVPSQMVMSNNLSKNYVLGNAAAGLIAGVGGIPWRIDEVPGGAEAFIGLDVTYDHDTGQHIGASANVVYADGTIIASESKMLQAGEKFVLEDIRSIIKDLLRAFVREKGRAPNEVVIFRDGFFYEETDTLLEQLQSGIDMDITLAELRKSGAPRIIEYAGEWEIAPKGTAFINSAQDYAFLATTGKPELDEKSSPGTPQPIQVHKVGGDTDIETLVKQAYWFSEAHVGSINRSTRVPIPTYYADLCANHAREGFLVSGELVRGAPFI